MNQKLLRKALATTMAVILTFTNFIMLGLYATKTYATMDELENQKTVSNNENVNFDAYFVDETGVKSHTSKQDIDKQVKLYLAINVQKGYLKNAKIESLGQDKKESNFKMLNNENNLELIENVDVENNKIALKQINGGTQIVLEIPIVNKKSENFDLSNFSKINNIKLTGSYIDNNGKDIAIEKTINIRCQWQKETKMQIEQETKIFVPYETEETSGTILQTVIKTGLENNALPIKQTDLTVNVPQINGKEPEEILISYNNNTYVAKTKKSDVKKDNVANNTEVKKDETNQLNEDQFMYNEETKELKIITNNLPNENKVKWDKTKKDEYVVTYIFKEKLEQIKAEQKAKVTIESYNSVITKENAENTLTIEENEKKGNFVETEISSCEMLSKGYLYAKLDKEVEYEENVKLTIAYKELVDKIIVENSIDNFVKSNGEVEKTVVDNNNYSYYKETTINKENFEKILGQDGYIKILTQNGENLYTFTKQTFQNEQQNELPKENYTYKYNGTINTIIIETSKPITEGTLEINHKKSLKGKTNYTKTQVEDFQKLQLKVITKVENTITNQEHKIIQIENNEVVKDINLIAPSTKIDVAVNKPSLSTVVKNEDVEIRVILKTNEISCDLYKNPTIEIVLPNYIKELKIKDVNLLFDNELKIKERKTYVNDNGNIVINIKLEGEQTAYSENEISKGANVVINTDITLETLTPTKDDIIKAYVTNELATMYEKAGENTTVKKVATRTVQNSNIDKAYARCKLKSSSTNRNGNNHYHSRI